ncbi:MAG: cyclic nucleotide-binding domain-containing protein [Cellulomonas sp.]|nr:cyclic nucleotide-binding domain-containing protein [Cellulomonas sp.]
MRALPLAEPEPCVRLVPVFAGLTAAQQAEVGRFARPVTVRAGDAVARAGERSSRLFVLHSGSVKVRRLSAAGHETILRVLTPGEVVGEEAFLTGDTPEARKLMGFLAGPAAAAIFARYGFATE